LLTVETSIHYTRAFAHLPPATETHKLGPLPQIYASSLDGPELCRDGGAGLQQFAAVCSSEAADTLPSNYGQAGAIALLGRKIWIAVGDQGHQSDFLVGTARITRAKV